MTADDRFVPVGYHDVAAGNIASVVTDLEMLAPPGIRDVPLQSGFTLEPVSRIGVGAYRALFRKIGADWLWFSRLFMSDDELSAIITDPDVEIHILRSPAEEVGILELDFREHGACELTFLGLTHECTGKGLGRALMGKALALAWSRPIRRMWLHTCTHDHPAALGFYINAGFTPYAFRVEVQADPRLSGHLPVEAAPRIPIIAPRPRAGAD